MKNNFKDLFKAEANKTAETPTNKDSKSQARQASQSPARNLARTTKFSRKLINKNFLDNQDGNDVIVEAPGRNRASPENPRQSADQSEEEEVVEIKVPGRSQVRDQLDQINENAEMLEASLTMRRDAVADKLDLEKEATFGIEIYEGPKQALAQRKTWANAPDNEDDFDRQDFHASRSERDHNESREDN